MFSHRCGKTQWRCPVPCSIGETRRGEESGGCSGGAQKGAREPIASSFVAFCCQQSCHRFLEEDALRGEPSWEGHRGRGPRENSTFVSQLCQAFFTLSRSPWNGFPGPLWMCERFCLFVAVRRNRSQAPGLLSVLGSPTGFVILKLREKNSDVMKP